MNEIASSLWCGTSSVFPWGDNPDDGKGWANLADQTSALHYSIPKPFNWNDGYAFTAPARRVLPIHASTSRHRSPSHSANASRSRGT